MSSTTSLKDRVKEVIQQFIQQDLRYSYYVAAGLILLGALVNLFLAHGWTVWPFVFVASFMTMVHEAAERSGQGVPPLYVYAGFVSMLALWVVGALIFSALPPVVLLIGAIAIIYQCAKGYILQHQRNALVQYIKQRSNELLQVEEGSLYPALQRLLKERLVDAEWEISASNRRVRTYRITSAGKTHLEREMFSFERMLEGVTLVLSPSEN